MIKNLKKITDEKNFNNIFFYYNYKNYNLPIPRPP
jgi:hypothetical protein